MPIIQSCCCWRSLRRGCYAAAIYTMIYFSITIVTMGHFIDMEQRYLNGDLMEPESESFLEPDKITPITVSLNITLLACSTMGLISCVMLILGVYKDLKFMLLPWILSMGLETLVEVINVVYLFYLQTLAIPEDEMNEMTLSMAEFNTTEDAMDFNPITSFLFTLDFFIIVLNLYAMVCVISQFQEYLEGRGTATYDYNDRMATVQYTATNQQTTTTSSAPSGRRRSAGRPTPSRCDPEEFSEAPTKTITSVLSKPSRSAVKKHVQFPDEQSCIEEANEPIAEEETVAEEKPDTRVISSLWMELETATPVPER
ncbi:uncharacterized protein LOC114244552 [Bombyx mandarina]|uniref:Uncharacterized protein n=2 Tax=Bombyx TaxID=7090 RepID=A0A8R2HP88_BOMMO|nr:uncharacterized protein LOC105842162 isoform X1 [Bombyx mori]XP_028032207.1 uncharacterized protein LOC114244552 [Bombyx mandarina]